MQTSLQNRNVASWCIQQITKFCGNISTWILDCKQPNRFIKAWCLIAWVFQGFIWPLSKEGSPRAQPWEMPCSFSLCGSPHTGTSHTHLDWETWTFGGAENSTMVWDNLWFCLLLLVTSQGQNNPWRFFI